MADQDLSKITATLKGFPLDSMAPGTLAFLRQFERPGVPLTGVVVIQPNQLQVTYGSGEAEFGMTLLASEEIPLRGLGCELNAWNPIETAPKNKRIDLWCIGLGPKGTRFTECIWTRKHNEEFWVDSDDYRLANHGVTPTHWRLPPDAPAGP